MIGIFDFYVLKIKFIDRLMCNVNKQLLFFSSIESNIFFIRCSYILVSFLNTYLNRQISRRNLKRNKEVLQKKTNFLCNGYGTISDM